MIYRCVAMFILPDADFADDAEERRSFIVLKENKSAFFCVICARLRPVNTSKHTVKSSFMIQDAAGCFAIPRRSAGRGWLIIS